MLSYNNHFNLVYYLIYYFLSVLIGEDHPTEREGESCRERSIKTLENIIPVQIIIDQCHQEDMTMLIVTHMRVLTVTLIGMKVIPMDHLQRKMTLTFTHSLLGIMEIIKRRIQTVTVVINKVMLILHTPGTHGTVKDTQELHVSHFQFRCHQLIQD